MNTLFEVRKGRFINLTIYENPASTTTVFMIHGLGGRSSQWREQISVLQDKYTLIVPDLLGHGESEKPKPGCDNPYDPMEFIRDLQIIFKKYAGPENYVMGHSYGGMLATLLTCSNLDTIKKLILIAPVDCEPREKIPGIFSLPAFILEYFRGYMEKNFISSAFDKTAKSSLIEEEMSAGKMNPMYVIKAMMKGMKDIPFTDVSQLNIPALVIDGETDRIISLMQMMNFYSKLPQRQFTMLRDASHMVMLEQAQKTNELLLNFL